MITFKQSGNFNQTEKFLTRAFKIDYKNILQKYGQLGVMALASVTPVDSRLTSHSWSYKVAKTKDSYRIDWSNTNVVDGVSIAIILQYGHATKNGGYVQGRDYINPAVQPIFDQLTAEMWKEVTAK